MARYRKTSMVSAIALAVCLTACGGGGGGVGSIPPPPVTPPPPPPPPPLPIEAAAQAVLPAANLFPQAQAGGPTIQDHALTNFPLIESVVTIDSTGVGPDDGAMSGGADLDFEATGHADDEYSLSVPGAGLSHVDLTAGGFYCYGDLCGAANGQYVEVTIADPATSDLSWTTYGFWDAYESSGTHSYGAFVTGYRTPDGAVPTSGTATYNGSVTGRLALSNSQGIQTTSLFGDASLQANFGSGSISGDLTNMHSGFGTWNSVSLLGNISGGNFTGTSAATSAPGTPGSLSGSATGTFAGMFFGPSAQELGAVWTLYDGSASAVGTIGAARP